MDSLDALPDGELWRLAATHDGPAFGEIFERHAKAVHTHCFRRSGSWSQAEDLTSVVFLEAWRRRRQVQLHGDSVLPWLLAVANNCILNAERALRRHRRLLAKLPRPIEVPDPSEDANARIDDERTMVAILTAFNRLSLTDRDVISLCDWAGLDYAEAAIALGIPIGTVRSRLSRARTRLRQLVVAKVGGATVLPNTSEGAPQ